MADKTNEKSYQRIHLAAGQKLFQEGDQGTDVFLIEEGKVEIYKKRKDGVSHMTIATLKRGELVGELSLIRNKPRMATVSALENTTLVVIPRHEFEERLAELNPVMRRVMKVMAERLRKYADEHAAEDTSFFRS